MIEGGGVGFNVYEGFHWRGEGGDGEELQG